MAWPGRNGWDWMGEERHGAASQERTGKNGENWLGLARQERNGKDGENWRGLVRQDRTVLVWCD